MGVVVHPVQPHGGPYHAACSSLLVYDDSWPSMSYGRERQPMKTPRGVRRTDTRLSDGRELIYYDRRTRRPASRSRTPADCTARDQARRSADRPADEWVAVASHRQTRTHLPPTDECPLCPSRAGQPTEIPSPDYDVVVFENRFPSFAGTSGVAPGSTVSTSCAAAERPMRGRLLHLRPRRVVRHPDTGPRADRDGGVGRPHRRARRARTTSSRSSCFENRGPEIGVTLQPPARADLRLPVRDRRGPAQMLDSARAAPRTHRSATCSTTCWPPSSPTAAGWSTENEHWIAFVPGAARWPVEVHLYPAPPGGRPARRSTTRSATTSPESTSTCCAPRRALRRAAALHLRPGTRRRSGSTATSRYLHLRAVLDPRAAATSSSTWPARSPAWAPSSTTSRPSRLRRSLRERCLR